MRGTWQLQNAKNRFSEVVDKALREGPQTVTRHGKPAVVVVSADEWRKLTREGRDFKRFLRSAPLAGVDLVRAKDAGRRVVLP